MRVSSIRPWLAALVLLLPLLAFYRWQMSQPAAAAPVAGAAAPVGVLSGQAEVLRASDAAWQAVSKDSLYVGDSVRALGDLRLTFGEGTIVDLNKGAQIVIGDLRAQDGSLTLLHKAGMLVIDTNNPRLRVQSASMALTVERAQFRVALDENGNASVVGERGLVYSASDGEVVAVAAGESLRTGIGQRATVVPGTPIALPPPPPPPPRTPTPTATPVPPTQPPERIHIVARGDTLSEIAARYGVSQDAIVKANGMDNPNMLYVGQKLIIPPAK